jgi:hypothetical protein
MGKGDVGFRRPADTGFVGKVVSGREGSGDLTNPLIAGVFVEAVTLSQRPNRGPRGTASFALDVEIMLTAAPNRIGQVKAGAKRQIPADEAWQASNSWAAVDQRIPTSSYWR